MKINNIAKIAVCVLGLLASSCDYLDVVPAEKASVDNTMDNYSQALGFLYECYRGVTIPVANDWAQGINQEIGQPLPGMALSDYSMTTDEWVMDDIQLNNNVLARALYSNTLSANNNFNTLKNYSIRLSMVFLFLEKLNTLGVPNGIVPESAATEWRAEAKFLIAFYHYCMLRRYGPIAIVENRVSMDAPISEFPGRMHYDYCVDWICKQLDEAAADLPAVRNGAETGRATSTICKALKARILLYAASPLFNGQFPYPNWTNKVETPGYGTELISRTYDQKKWVRAKEASEEALALALGEGDRELYYGSSSNESQDMIDKTFVPVDDVTDDFKRAVLRMRNVISAKPTEGNKEGIWALWNMASKPGDMRYRIVRNPVPKNASMLPQGFVYAYGTVSATLATVLRFGTKNGYQPANDPSFPPKANGTVRQATAIPTKLVARTSSILTRTASLVSMHGSRSTEENSEHCSLTANVLFTSICFRLMPKATTRLMLRATIAPPGGPRRNGSIPNRTSLSTARRIISMHRATIFVLPSSISIWPNVMPSWAISTKL